VQQLFKKELNNLEGLLKNKRFDESLERFKKLKEKGQLSRHGYRVMIRELGKVDINKAWELFQDLNRERGTKKPEYYCFRYFLCYWARARNVNKVTEMLNEMSRVKVPLDMLSCHSLMGMYAESGNDVEATKLISTMRQNGLVPDSDIYGGLLLICKNKQDYDGLEATWEEMKRFNVKPNKYIYDILFQAWSNRNPQKVEALFKEMTESELRPDRQIYRSLLVMWMNEEDMNKVQELITQAEQNNVGLDKATFNLLLSRCKTPEQVKAILSTMESKQISFDIFTYNSLLSFWSRKQHLVKVKQVLDQMNANQVRFDLVTYNTLLNFYAEIGDASQVEALLAAMEREQIMYDLITFNTLINFWAKLGDIEKMEQLLWLMIKRRLEIDIYTCDIFLRSTVNQGSEMIEIILDYMKKRSIKKNRVICDSLIGLWGGKGDILRLSSLLEEMRSDSLPRDLTLYGNIISALEKTNDHRHWVWVLKEMKRDNIRPTPEMASKVLNKAKAVGDTSASQIETQLAEMSLTNSSSQTS